MEVEVKTRLLVLVALALAAAACDGTGTGDGVDVAAPDTTLEVDAAGDIAAEVAAHDTGHDIAAEVAAHDAGRDVAGAGDIASLDSSVVDVGGLCAGRDCDDGNPCTDDWCNPETGACHHSDIDCDDGDPETYDFCISWGVDTPHCINDGLCEEDGDLCTLPTPNACVPMLKDCDDGDPCTTDVCDPATGDCVNTPDGC